MDIQDQRSAADVIIEEVTSWPGVETGPGNFGAVQLRLGKRELGHLHGDTLADIPFTKAVRDDLLARGEIVRHRPLPDSGWGSRHIRDEDDVQAVIRLLRMQYDRATAARAARGAAAASAARRT
ncbi:MAG: DUF5519 family protein [Candidatus Dormibacteraeota bacterium]|nr:DUF5519 family protein [Candidatus Dormibacteraeota bacterium]MBO0761146.1 DUF5519 family protein [Candidatus Dormibacteraeota bacterium]